MGAEAAVAVGNVVMSRPFQFAINQTASRTGIARVPWSPRMPGKRTLAINCWIYAIEVGEHNGDQLPILAAEFHADKDGNLGFVDGGKRRTVEATEKGAPVPARIPTAALPLARQGKRLRYRFVATRGRLGKAAIADLENWLDPIYEPQNLAQEDVWYHVGEDGVTFVDVVDPLTVAESLRERYLRACNEALAFTTPAANKGKDQVLVERRSRLYQLGHVMLQSLVEPEGGGTDPLRLDGYLKGGVDGFKKFLKDYEDELGGLIARRSVAMRELRRFLESRIWDRAMFWYLGTPDARNTVGHFWLGASFFCLDRVSESPEGRDFLRDLVAQADEGLLSFLFPPTPGSRGEELYGEIFPIVRKTATAAVIAFGETAPAMILYGKKTIDVVERVRVTLENMFLSTTVVAVKRVPRGAVTHLYVKTDLTVALHIEIDYRRTKVDYEEWVKNGKPHWPEETWQAKWSEIAGRLFIGVELVNLYSTFTKSIDKYNKQSEEGDKEIKARRLTADFEALGACVDLAVAAEDPLHALGRHFDSVWRSGGAAEGEHEIAGLFGKLTKPAMFKALGAVSAVIDTVCYYREAGEARERHETGMAAGNYAVSLGSGLIAVASVFNAAGYLTSSVAVAAGLTAAASIILLVGVVIVVIGYIIIACFTTTPWQRFVDHSSYGLHPALAGHDSWSGGDFSAWTDAVPGLARQMQVLTTMMCAFTVSGDMSDAQTIFVNFGGVPPNAKLHVRYAITYANQVTFDAAYVIDLETGRHSCEAGAPEPRQCKLLRTRDRYHRPQTLILQADRPEAARMTMITRAQAEIVMRYGGSSSAADDAASGTIPISGAMTYKLFRDGVAYTNEYKSLDVEHREEESEKKAGGEHPDGSAGEEPGTKKGE